MSDPYTDLDEVYLESVEPQVDLEWVKGKVVNVPRMRKESRQWQVEHPERVRENQRKWWKENRERLNKERSVKRTAKRDKKRGGPVTLSQSPRAITMRELRKRKKEGQC